MKVAAVSLGMFALLLLPACKGSEAAAKQSEWADKICACKDMECVKGVQKEQEEWIAKNGAEMQATEGDAKKIEEATKKMTDCHTKMMTAGAGG
jgi:predicted alpha/beta hydrolase family esterase